MGEVPRVSRADGEGKKVLKPFSLFFRPARRSVTIARHESWPERLTKWRGGVRERAGGTRREPPAPAVRLSRFFARHESRNTDGTAVRFAVGEQRQHDQKAPPGPPQPPTSHGLPVHHCSLVFLWRGPEQVSAPRPPFSIGLTTSAVRRRSGRPAGCCRRGEGKRNPC